jgi:hypothetical protein
MPTCGIVNYPDTYAVRGYQYDQDILGAGWGKPDVASLLAWF